MSDLQRDVANSQPGVQQQILRPLQAYGRDVIHRSEPRSILEDSREMKRAVSRMPGQSVKGDRLPDMLMNICAHFVYHPVSLRMTDCQDCYLHPRDYPNLRSDPLVANFSQNQDMEYHLLRPLPFKHTYRQQKQVPLRRHPNQKGFTQQI
jgi:hypothetical protein